MEQISFPDISSLFPVQRDKSIFHLKTQSLSQLVAVHHQSHGVHKTTTYCMLLLVHNSKAMNIHRFRCK